MTLRAFIRFIGGIVFVVGLGLIAFFFVGYLIYAIYHRGLVIGLIVGAVLFSFIGVLIARTGWRMLRRWDNAVVVEYAEIQSFITGIAVGKITGLYWPHATGIAIGFLAFLIIRRPMRRLVLGVLGMPAEHSRRAVEMAMHSDVAGTPWQNNSAHTR